MLAQGVQEYFEYLMSIIYHNNDWSPFVTADLATCMLVHYMPQ